MSNILDQTAKRDVIQTHRLDSVDLLRGFIMVVMALDHASAFIAKVHFSEFWGFPLPDYNDNGLHFFTRFITHICAPGFFLLMGIGMSAFAKNRKSKGWSNRKIATYFLKRGLIILLAHQLIENPAWLLGMMSGESTGPTGNFPGVMGDMPVLVFGVLFSLAFAMIIWGLLIRLPSWLILLLSIAAILITQMLVPPAAAVTSEIVWWRTMLLLPGAHTFGFTLYPVIPWVGLTGFGLVYGRLLGLNRSKTIYYGFLTGIGMLALFFALKLLGGFGNLHLPEQTNLIDFLKTTKYPPSITFILFGIGINLILLFLFSKIKLPNLPNIFLLTFGKTAMFFYLLHLYLYGLLGYLFPQGVEVYLMYGVWLIGLLVLYPMCKRYLNFKQQTPVHSFWRYF